MKIAVASGKGGTGKTTVASSLFSVWPELSAAIDLDVEEPNLHIFLGPDPRRLKTVWLEVPELDEERCTYCGLCSQLCQFKAISIFDGVGLTFPEMCHACGGCFQICPAGALKVVQREIGSIHGNQRFLMGRLRVGEAMSPPLIRAVRREAERIFDPSMDLIIDAPPGVSCPAAAAVRDTDFILLVAEPTPFGCHDLKLAHQAFEPFGIPMGVAINRSGIGDDEIYNYCSGKGLEIMAEIPFDRAVAEAYSFGRIVARFSEKMGSIFRILADSIRRKVLQHQAK